MLYPNFSSYCTWHGTERSIIREAESNGQSSVSIDAEMLEPVTLPVETERAAYVPLLHSI